LDTGECLHEDFPIPIGQTFPFKGKRFTGNGNSLFNFLLLNGVDINTIESLKYYSYNLEDYIQEYKQQYQDLSVQLPKIVMLKNVTIDTHNFPENCTYIPDFLSISQSDILFNKLKKLNFVDNVVQYTRPIGDEIVIKYYCPIDIVCFLDIFIKNKFIHRYPDNIYINFLGKGQGMLDHMDDPKYDEPIVVLSLGSNVLMNFNKIVPASGGKTGKSLQCPILNGSVIIYKGKSRYDYTREIKNNTIDNYNIKGFPSQTWERSDRISIILRFLK
jgi:alkylated DNA repair dioxygenase AlkB